MADHARLRLDLPVEAARNAVASALSAQGFTVQLAPSGALDVSRGSLGTTLVAGALAGQDMHVRFDVLVSPEAGGALAEFQHSSVGGFFKGGAIGASKAADVVREAAHNTGARLAQQGFLHGSLPLPSTAAPTNFPPPYAAGALPFASVGSIPPPIDYANRTNVVAIVALILGFVVPVGGIVAGAVGLAQIRRTGERGRGLAIGGIVAGSIFTALAIAAVFAFLAFAAVIAAQESAVTPAAPFTSIRPDGTSGDDATGDLFSLRVGECLDDVPTGVITDVNVIDCAGPHTHEVYTEFPVPGDALPATDELDSIADEGCYAAFTTFVGLSYEESTLDFSYLIPTEQSWAAGDQLISCLITDPAGPTAGTLAGAGR